MATSWRVLQPSDVPYPLKALFIVALLTGFSGVVGTGYCEHEQRLAFSRTPSPALPIPSNYKGEVRFISQTDAHICNISSWTCFGGMGSAALLNLLAYVLDRRRR